MVANPTMSVIESNDLDSAPTASHRSNVLVSMRKSDKHSSYATIKEVGNINCDVEVNKKRDSVLHDAWVVFNKRKRKALLFFESLSPRCRLLLMCSFFTWKVISYTILFCIISNSYIFNKGHKNMDSFVLLPANNENQMHSESSRIRILHVVTTLAEYQTGRRNTVRGADRLQEIIIPAMRRSVESMLSMENCDVDVYLICGFDLKPERLKLIEDSLPDGVGLEVWRDATPIGYDGTNVIRPITRSLARQHRYVLKDKLYEYDFFTIFEDDMIITRDHVINYNQMSHEIERLKNDAKPGSLNDPIDKSFTGSMTEIQLQRLIPGFIRVEVLKPNSVAQQTTGPITVQEQSASNSALNASICCSLPPEYPLHLQEDPVTSNPQFEQLMIWETGIQGMSLRQLPKESSIDWVALQPGPKNRSIENGQVIGGYWSGNDGDFDSRPSDDDPRFFGQQGGFMASRDQILFYDKVCPAGFLPPFEEPKFKDDGLYMNNVEFWSGGWQLYGNAKRGSACNLQRIISLDPEVYSKQLLYHVSNNKQLQISRERRLRASDFFGQLNTVKERAEIAKSKL